MYFIDRSSREEAMTQKRTARNSYGFAYRTLQSPFLENEAHLLYDHMSDFAEMYPSILICSCALKMSARRGMKAPPS